MELSSLIFSHVSQGTCRDQKVKKKKTLWKSFLYFGRWNFLALSLKNILYFRRELVKPKKQTKNSSLFFITASTTLSCSFLAIELLITHSDVDIWQNFGCVLRVKRKKNICTSGNVRTLQIILRTFEVLHLY